MEKNLQSQELQDLKELNKQIIKINGHKIKIVLEENNDGSMNLQFQLKDKPKSLLPHLEATMNICYSDLISRNINNINDFKECKKKVETVIASWKNFDVDEIVYEANRYLRDELNHNKIVVISIDSDKKIGSHKFYASKFNEVFLISKEAISEKNRTLENFEIVEILGKKFIDLGYINYEQLKNIAFEKRQNSKIKKIILRIKGLNTYRLFYFDNDKNNYYKTFDNCRISSNQSRTPLNSKVCKKNVMIIGLGAIGSHVSELIASLWPKNIVVWDRDCNFANSSTRQNYAFYNEPLPKSNLIKARLHKYKNVKVTPQNSSFPEINGNEMPSNFDYIIDCTGEAIIASEFKEITKYAKENTIIAAAYILKNLFIKIVDFKTLKKDGVLAQWHKYDIINDKNNKQNKVFKGCSEVLEYSYIDVYNIASKLVARILKYQGEKYDFKEINAFR